MPALLIALLVFVVVALATFAGVSLFDERQSQALHKRSSGHRAEGAGTRA